MRCPKCKLYSLKEFEGKVVCSSCGYRLSAGESTRFRLFELLEKEGATRKRR